MAEGVPTDKLLVHLSLFTLAGAASNYAFSHFAGPWLSQKIEGCPRWGFMVSLVFQLVIFPGLCLTSLARFGSSEDYLRSPWTEDDFSGVRTTALILMMYLSKDLLPCICEPLVVVHHVAGWCVTFSLFWSTHTMPGYLLCCMVMELANIFLNVSVLYKGPARAVVGGFVLLSFTAAHITVGYLLYRLSQLDGNRAVYATIFAITVPVVALRQREAIQRFQASRRKLETKAV